MLSRLSPVVRQPQRLVRAIGSSRSAQWDEVRQQRHPGDQHSPMLQLPKTVSIIGAPMTCAFCFSFVYSFCWVLTTNSIVKMLNKLQTDSRCWARTRVPRCCVMLVS